MFYLTADRNRVHVLSYFLMILIDDEIRRVSHERFVDWPQTKPAEEEKQIGETLDAIAGNARRVAEGTGAEPHYKFVVKQVFTANASADLARCVRKATQLHQTDSVGGNGINNAIVLCDECCATRILYANPPGRLFNYQITS